MLSLSVRPSQLPEIYWTHTYDDLKTLTRLHVQEKLVTAMSMTESLLFTAGKIFGASKKPEGKKLDNANDMMDFARMINGG